MHVCLLPWLSFNAHLLLSSILVWFFFFGFGFPFTFVNDHTCFCFIHACSVLFILVICGVPYLSVCLIAIVSFWVLLRICCSESWICLFFSSFFLNTLLVMLFGVCRRIFEVMYNGHGLCMFICYLFFRSACCLMLFFVCF